MSTKIIHGRSAARVGAWVALGAVFTGCPYNVIVGGDAPEGFVAADAETDADADAPIAPTVHCPQERLPSPEGDVIDEIGASPSGASCARTRRGEVLCWGFAPSWGWVGPPVRVAGLSCVRSLAGGRIAAAVLEDGSARSFFPASVTPQPGPGGGLPQMPPVDTRTVVAQPPGLGAVLGLDRADARFCAWDARGSVWCSGAPFFGERGTPSEPPSVNRQPIAVPTLLTSLRDVVQMSTSTDVSAGHGCVLHRDRTVSCLGQNGAFQLGDGTTTPRATPRRVEQLRDIVQVAVGVSLSCAVRADGRVLCWGDVSGDLPAGVTGVVNFVQMRGVVDATQVAAAQNHACARTARGRVLCWGRNSHGALGQENVNALVHPTEVPGVSDVLQVVTSAFHTCALRADHTVWCWGSGAGARTDPSVAEPVVRPRQITL